MVECNDTRAAERDQTTWTVQTQPDKYGSYFNSLTFIDDCVFLFGIVPQPTSADEPCPTRPPYVQVALSSPWSAGQTDNGQRLFG